MPLKGSVNCYIFTNLFDKKSEHLDFREEVVAV